MPKKKVKQAKDKVKKTRTRVVKKKYRKRSKKEVGSKTEARTIIRKSGNETKVFKKVVEEDDYNSYHKNPILPEDYVPPKTLKFAGYCPNCDTCIASSDFISDTKFECLYCGCKKNIKFLLKQSKAQKYRDKVSKQQYLKESLVIKNDDIESDIPDISTLNDISE